MEDTIRILYITYFFPPLGTVGVMRTLKFIKYLPDFGIKPTVITVKPIHHYAFDYSLLREIPEDIRVIKTESLEPLRIMKILKDFKTKFKKEEHKSSQMLSPGRRWGGIISRALLPPDEKVLWHPFLIPSALTEFKGRGYKAIITTSPPESIHLAGLIIHKITGIPWIADFRDGWTTTHIRRIQPPISRVIDEFFEKLVIRNCTKIITITDELRDEFIERYPETNPDKFITITNGYDPQVIDWHPPRKDTTKLVITHCGSFTTLQSALNLLNSVRDLLQESPSIEEKLQIRFVGVMKEEEVEMIERSGLSSVVEILGYLPHRESLEEQLNADILLLIAPGDIEKTRIYSKVFEYLWARRPILAIAPEGATVDMIRREGTGIIIHPDDREGIKEMITGIISHPDTLPTVKINDEFLKKYSRVKLTGKLAEVIKDINYLNLSYPFELNITKNK